MTKVRAGSTSDVLTWKSFLIITVDIDLTKAQENPWYDLHKLPSGTGRYAVQRVVFFAAFGQQPSSLSVGIKL